MGLDSAFIADQSSNKPNKEPLRSAASLSRLTDSAFAGEIFDNKQASNCGHGCSGMSL